MSQNIQVRTKTEVTVGNRRKPTEVTIGNRNQTENIYNKVWQEDYVAEPTNLQQYMQQICSAAFLNVYAFHRAVEEVQELTGYSGKKYQVQGALSQQGSESMVLLCEDEDGAQVVAKIYKDIDHRDGEDQNYLQKMIQVRIKVIEFTQSPEAEGYVLPIQDVGLVPLVPGTKNYFEIQPYCPAGDLSLLEKMNFEELIPVIAHLNEALRRIHLGGLLHLDIKPENLYQYKDKIVIGDFGIAHIQTDGKRMTNVIGGTIGYRAPETMFVPSVQNMTYYLTTAADYYSLGMTIASLYVGHYILEDMEGELSVIMCESHIPLPFSGDSNQILLQNLVDGLCQFDSQRRFGYEEVGAWLKNHNYRGKSENSRWPRAYTFQGKDCWNVDEFYTTLSENWEIGKLHLYRGFIEQFFASFHPQISQRAYEIVAKENVDEDIKENSDIGFLKFLNEIHPNGWFIWKNNKFEGLTQMAEAILSAESLDDYEEILKKKLLSIWLEKQEESDLAVMELVKRIETLAKTKSELACYWFGYAFGETKTITYLKQEINSAEQFVQNTLVAPKEFYAKENVLDSLTDEKKSTKIYGFLYSQGYQEIIELYMDKMKGLERAGKANMLFQLLEGMAAKLPKESTENAERQVRAYYRKYGPMGYIICLQDLIKSKQVYVTKTESGCTLLKQIEEIEIPQNVPISEMTVKMKQAAAGADQLLANMQNNPFLTELGIMENKIVSCKDLSGFFSYEFLGTLVPLKYERILAKEEGTYG